MKQRKMSEGALDVLLREHALLREEINERLKTAFSHLTYAGAIASFTIPVAEKFKEWISNEIVLLTVFVGFLFMFFLLAWVALLNMRWVQHAGTYVAAIEKRVNEHFGEYTMGWEHYADYARARQWWLIPSSPKLSVAPIEEILLRNEHKPSPKN